MLDHDSCTSAVDGSFQPAPLSSPVHIDLVLEAHDGVVGFYAGVGTVVSSTLEQLADLSARLRPLNVFLTVSAVSWWRAPSSYAFSRSVWLRSKELCESTGGVAVALDDGSDGSGVFELSSWVRGSCAASFWVTRRWASQPSTTYKVLWAEDVAAALTPVLVKQSFPEASVWWVPQSTAANQASGTGLLDVDRHKFERTCAVLAVSAGCRLGVASFYAWQHFQDVWGVPESSLSWALVGLNLGSSVYASTPVSDPESVLVEFGVPVDRDLVVSVGRAVPEKNLGALLSFPSTVFDSVPLSAGSVGVCRVVVASSYSASDQLLPVENRLVVEALQAQVDAVNTAASTSSSSLSHLAVLVSGFSRRLVLALLAWPRTRVVVSASLSEPLGMLGLEARWLSSQASLLVADCPGLKDHVVDGVTGDLWKPGCSIRSPDPSSTDSSPMDSSPMDSSPMDSSPMDSSLAIALVRVLSRPESSQRRLRAAARADVASRWSLEAHVLSMLEESVPSLTGLLSPVSPSTHPVPCGLAVPRADGGFDGSQGKDSHGG